jgi:hypothetical protein
MRLSAMLVLVALATLTGCGSSGGDSNESTTPTTPSGPTGGGTANGTLLFVTSVPSTGFRHQLNTFSNYGTGSGDAVAGGDLMLRYADGTLRNLTQEAGFGVASGGIQGGPKAISVRQPTVHWDGTKAVFAMLVGGATRQYEVATRYWQIYEVTGLGVGQTAIITKVPKQPAGYNNISPIYGSDDRIIFSSDKPLYGMAHTYPQLDEYESSPTVSGIWKLDPLSGELQMIEHCPSGVFDLFLDSYGRLLFTKWDHLKRDQEADLTRYSGGTYNPDDFADESATAAVTVFPALDGAGKLQADSRGALYDIFPEARDARDPTRNPNEALHDFNQFFIWQINEDGSQEETLNHVGRHEFGGTYMVGTFLDDPALSDSLGTFSANQATRGTVRADSGLFQLREDATAPGHYYGTYAQEFSRQASGRVMEFTMPPGANPEAVVMHDRTNATLDADPYGTAAPLSTMTGHYRNPLKLADGSWIVSHTPEYRVNLDTSTDPLVLAPRYVFRLTTFIANPAGGDSIAGPALTGGIVKDIRYWTDLPTPIRYNGPLNEHDVVEVRARPRPTTRSMATDPVESTVLSEEGIDEAALRAWLTDQNLALIVTRNNTDRDRADVQQPYNLRVPGGVSATASGGGGAGGAPKVYDIDHLQILQGDLTRSYESMGDVGRRVYIRPIHDSAQTPALSSANPPNATGPAGAVKLGLDGSMAAFVPAGRALTWQLTGNGTTGTPVVRERNWVTFAPGEIRTCASCHGVNSKTQTGTTEPVNKPQALRDLMTYWKSQGNDVVAHDLLTRGAQSSPAPAARSTADAPTQTASTTATNDSPASTCGAGSVIASLALLLGGLRVRRARLR